ncbi:unnamed protein product, partial [Nesidiocoris tenuis]
NDQPNSNGYASATGLSRILQLAKTSSQRSDGLSKTSDIVTSSGRGLTILNGVDMPMGVHVHNPIRHGSQDIDWIGTARQDGPGGNGQSLKPQGLQSIVADPVRRQLLHLPPELQRPLVSEFELSE